MKLIDMNTIKLSRCHSQSVRKNKKPSIALVKSIRLLGLVTPIQISPDKGGYLVVDGNLRLKACKSIGIKTVTYQMLDAKGVMHTSENGVIVL